MEMLSIHVEKKTELYTALVTSILEYSMDCHYLTTAHMQRLESVQTRHLRRLGESPAHIYRETNSELRTRLGIFSMDSKLRYKRLKLWQKKFQDDEMISVQAARRGVFPEEPQGNEQRTRLWLHDVTILIEQMTLSGDQVMDVTYDRVGDVNENRALWKWFLSLQKKQLKQILTHSSLVEPKARIKEGPVAPVVFRCTQCGYSCPTNHQLVTHRTKKHGVKCVPRHLHMGLKCLLCPHVGASKPAIQNHAQKVCWPKLSQELKDYWTDRVNAGTHLQ